MSNIKKLRALLEADENGEKIAGELNNLLVDEKKRNIFLARLIEIREQTIELEQKVVLTKVEEAVKDLVSRGKKPLTIQEVMDKLGPRYKSLRHRSHTSNTLNSLVSKGVLGKFKIGHGFYFMSPKDAVMEQLKRRDETPKSCSPAGIARDTGMPLDVVISALGEIG